MCIRDRIIEDDASDDIQMVESSVHSTPAAAPFTAGFMALPVIAEWTEHKSNTKKLTVFLVMPSGLNYKDY